MSDKVTPIQQMQFDIQFYKGLIGLSTTQVKILIEWMETYKPVERQFASEAYNAGEALEFGGSFKQTFDTYYSQYNNEK